MKQQPLPCQSRVVESPTSKGNKTDACMKFKPNPLRMKKGIACQRISLNCSHFFSHLGNCK